MKGIVLFFNVAKGFGFVKPEGSDELLFVHESKIRMSGFRALLAGMPVEYEIGAGTDGRPQAWNVTRLSGTTDEFTGGLLFYGGDRANLEKGGVVALSIQGGAPVADGNRREEGLANRQLEFFAYLVGGRVNGFRFELPRYDGKTVYLVLDPKMKSPVIVDDGRYEFAPVGSYLVRFCNDGMATIWTLGRRHQVEAGKNLNWAVVERRFEHRYDLSRPIADQDTPTTPGLERDNDGFIPSLEACRQFLNA